jgi:hypothetical protein
MALRLVGKEEGSALRAKTPLSTMLLAPLGIKCSLFLCLVKSCAGAKHQSPSLTTASNQIVTMYPKSLVVPFLALATSAEAVTQRGKHFLNYLSYDSRTLTTSSAQPTVTTTQSATAPASGINTPKTAAMLPRPGT